VLQCVAVCCSVLQCIETCYTVSRMTLTYCMSGCATSTRTLQCGVVCCSVLQCVAVCYSVLQCVAVCCRAKYLPRVRVCYFHLHVAVWCSMLQCVAVCCSVLQCVAVCCSVLQGKVLTTCLGVSATPTCMLQCVAVCYSVAVRTSVAVRCSVIQCVAVCYRVLTPTPSTAHSPPTATTAEGLANLTDDVALQCVAVRCSVLQCVANYLPLPPRYLHFSLLPPQKDSRT